MSRSRFLGTPARAVTTYEYDDGLLVRSETTWAPEWDDEDRAYALALLAEEREVCAGCQQPLSECRDPASEGQWEVDKSWCQACRILTPTMRADDGTFAGIYYGVHRNHST